MVAGSGDRHRIEYFEKIKVEPGKKILCRPFFLRELTPCVIDLLCLPEDRIDIRLCIQLFIDFFLFPFIGESQLVPQIIKAIVHRRGRKHQYFCAHTRLNHTVHQAHVPVFFFPTMGVCSISVTKIVALVDHHKVIISPIDPLNWKTDRRHSAVSG